MRGQGNMEQCFDAIMGLKGADEFKEIIKRLHVFLQNKDAYPESGITLPNYLVSARRGGGVTTLVTMFAEYLYAAKAIEFCGTVKSFEFKLDYMPPESACSELTRLDNSISGFAGHNRYYKGVICVDIDEWVEHTGEDHFAELVKYISGGSGRLLVIFCIHNDNKSTIESVEAALSSYTRLESMTLRFPDAKELVDLMESRYIQGKGFSLTENAKILLCESITEIAAGKQFNGFKSIARLADDILFTILTTGSGGSRHISSDMLLRYSKDSTYVKRARMNIGSGGIIGFTGRSM